MIKVENIKIGMIQPSPMNPRKTFDAESIDELAKNIKKQGLLQPITVRAVEFNDFIDEATAEVYSLPTKYEIVCGERRYRACKQNSMDKIPCIVKDMTDAEAFDAMITENLQRQDVDPVEEGFAFGLLLENGSKVEDVANRFGKSVRFVQDRIKLNNLIPELKQWLKEEIISITGAMMLSKANENIQKEFYNPQDLSWRGSYTNKDIKDFLSRQFRRIDQSLWAEGDFSTESIPLCKNCIHNTANHGCLFYEMKNKNGQCSNPECYSKKEFAYVLKCIDEHADELVKAGEELEFGKMVLLDTEQVSYGTKQTVSKDDLVKAIKERGYEIVTDKAFSGRCFYDIDDERMEDLIAQKKVYKVMTFYGYYGGKAEIGYYYTKTTSVGENGITTNERDNEVLIIKNQITRNKAICKEKSISKLKEFALDKKFYCRTGELTEEEQMVFDMLIVKNSISDFLDANGLDMTFGEKNAEYYRDFIKNNQDKRCQWQRAFIQEKLTESSVLYNGVLRDCLFKYLNETYQDETMEIIMKANKDMERKNKKLVEQLKELGYDEDGNKIVQE